MSVFFVTLRRALQSCICAMGSDTTRFYRSRARTTRWWRAKWVGRKLGWQISGRRIDGSFRALDTHTISHTHRRRQLHATCPLLHTTCAYTACYAHLCACHLFTPASPHCISPALPAAAVHAHYSRLPAACYTAKRYFRTTLAFAPVCRACHSRRAFRARELGTRRSHARRTRTAFRIVAKHWAARA